MNEEYKPVDSEDQQKYVRSYVAPQSTLKVGICYNLLEKDKEFMGPIYLGKYEETNHLKTGIPSRNNVDPVHNNRYFVHYFEKRHVSIDPENLYAETTCVAKGGRRASKTRRGRRRASKTRSKRK